MVVEGGLGRIRESARHSARGSEDEDLLGALALILSLAPLESRTVRRRTPPPAPPVTVDPPPQESRPQPTDEAPLRIRAAYLLTVLFPPVGHVWNRSPLASPKRRAAPRRVRRRPRIWPPRPERFAYFPQNGSGHPAPQGRRRVTFAGDYQADSDAGESRDDATLGVSAAESRFNSERYPGREGDFGR